MKRGLLVLLLVCLLVCGCNKITNKRILMVIAPNDFKDEELYIPKSLFVEESFSVTITSSVKEAISAAGKKQKADILLKDATTDYDALVFVGGPGAAVYFNNTSALNLVKKFYENNKVVGAICLAPVILSKAGILNKKAATVFPTEKNLLKGANYTGEAVTVDGNIVTGMDPDSAEEFAEEIIKLLK